MDDTDAVTRPTLLIACAALALDGCTLIDRTTFAPEPELPAPTQLSGAALPDRRAPLVTIRYETANPAYETPLEEAVRAAEGRRPNLEYDVVAVVPQNPTPPAQAEILAQARDDATTVMRTIMDVGVPETRIRLSARIDPRITARETRVYVR